MKKLLVVLIFLTSYFTNAQSWCTEQFNPKVNLQGADKSPDYKKKYTAYFYFKQKAGRKTFFTPIYKLTFINYDNNKLLLGANFYEKLREASLKLIKEKYPNTFIPYSSNRGGGHCLSLADLKKEYQKQIGIVKRKNNEVIMTGDVNIETFSYKGSGKYSQNQELTFTLVE